MAVTKTKSGRWKAKINYRDDEGSVRTKEKLFDTKGEAKNFEVDFRRQVKSDTHERDSITYQDVFDSYLLSVKMKISNKTYNEKIYYVNTFWKNMLPKRYTNISKKDWMNIYNNILSLDYAVGYKNKIIINLKAVAHHAYLYYDLPNNTKLLETIPERKKIDHPFWDAEEMNKVLDSISNRTSRLLVKSLFYTGARREELRMMTKSDFNVKNNSFMIRDNKYRTLKTAGSSRIVKIHEELALEIQEVLQFEGEFIFGGIEPISKTTLTRHFKQAIKDSGVKEIRLHDLRHSHATILINQGANIIAVSRRLGHSTTSQTLKTYAHLMQKSDDELLDIIEKI